MLAQAEAGTRGSSVADERDLCPRHAIDVNDDIREVEARRDKCANGSAKYRQKGHVIS